MPKTNDADIMDYVQSREEDGMGGDGKLYADEHPDDKKQMEQSMMEKYVKDVRDATEALRGGKTKQAMSILNGILEDYSDMDNQHPTMENDSMSMPTPAPAAKY